MKLVALPVLRLLSGTRKSEQQYQAEELGRYGFVPFSAEMIRPLVKAFMLRPRSPQ
jgi:hypothetical protein